MSESSLDPVWTMSGPLFCPRCGDAFRFSSISELRVHLITRHTYETLLLLSQARVRPRPRSLLSLPGPTAAQAQRSSLGMELQDSPRILDLAFSSSTSLVLPETFLAVDVGLEERLGLGLGLGSKIVRTLWEVEERVNHKVERLESRLRHKEALLRRQRDTEDKLRAERQELDTRMVHLSAQASAAEELMDHLRTQLQEREAELQHKQQEMEQIETFLLGLAQKEAEAKVKLQVFIESLLDRAEQAERHLLLLTADQDLSRLGLDEAVRRRLQESSGNRRSFSLSDSDRPQLHSVWDCAPTRTHSLGSPDQDIPPNTSRFVEGGWGQTWSKPSHPHHGNEDKQHDD